MINKSYFNLQNQLSLACFDCKTGVISMDSYSVLSRFMLLTFLILKTGKWKKHDYRSVLNFKIINLKISSTESLDAEIRFCSAATYFLSISFRLAFYY